jgi:hypothetical protein
MRTRAGGWKYELGVLAALLVVVAELAERVTA